MTPIYLEIGQYEQRPESGRKFFIITDFLYWQGEHPQ